MYGKVENNKVVKTQSKKPSCMKVSDVWLPITYEDLGACQEYGDPIFSDDAITYPAVDMANEDIIKKNETSAKISRDTAIKTNIIALESEWQVDSTARERMSTAIETSKRNAVTVGWILADNTVRNTTAAELGQVLDAYALRMADVFEQYTAWRSGDKLTAFEYMESSPESI